MSLQHLLKYERRLLKEKRNILEEKRSLIFQNIVTEEDEILYQVLYQELEVLDRELELLKLLLYQKKLLILHQKFLDNFQIDPSWEDFGKVTDEKIDFQIDPSWEDFGKVVEEVKDEDSRVEEEKIDFQIDPVWEDFGEEERVKRITEEERVKRIAEEERVKRVAKEKRVAEEKLTKEQIRDIFGERFQYLTGSELYTEALSRLAPYLIYKIKKVLEKDETIAFFDYTYSRFMKDYGDNPHTILTNLNYLDIITNEGHIYSVKFQSANSNNKSIEITVPHYPPNYPMNKDIIKLIPNYYLIMVEKTHTFNPTKRNLDMLKKYNFETQQKVKELPLLYSSKYPHPSEIYKVLSLLD